ncbi:hypothetical protein D9M68_534810 [compost metagenome]
MRIKTLVQGIPLGKIGLVGYTMHPGFTKKGKLRIFFGNALRPVSHKCQIIVCIGIQAETIQTGILDPPDVALG